MPPKLTLKNKLEAYIKIQNKKTMDEKVTGNKQTNTNTQAERIADENKQHQLTLNVSGHKIDQNKKYVLNSYNSASKDKEKIVNEDKSTNLLSSNEKQESSSIVQKDNTTGPHQIFEADVNFTNDPNLIRNEKRKSNVIINNKSSFVNSTVHSKNVILNFKHKEGSTYTTSIVKEESLSSESYQTYQENNITGSNIGRNNKQAMSKSNVDNKKNVPGSNSLCNSKNEESIIINDKNEPTDTVTTSNDKQAEPQVSDNNTSTCSNLLKRKRTTGNKSIQSYGNLVLKNQQEVSNEKQISLYKINVVAKTKPGTSGISKTRVISKQKSESKKFETSGTTLEHMTCLKKSCNSKTDHKTEPHTIKNRQRNANHNKSYVENNDDDGDFSDSSSSWAPSECNSDSDYEAKIKKMKMTPIKQYTNSNKDTRARPVVPQMRAPDISLSTANQNLPVLLNDKSNSRNDDKTENADECESVKTAISYLKAESNLCLKKCQEIMNILNTMKEHKKKPDLQEIGKSIEVSEKCGNSSNNKEDKGDHALSDSSSKSDDHNVLISNKYKNIKDIKTISNKRRKLKRPKCKNINGSQMVALGSGTTLISKAIYEKINWSSYAKATRCLLRAVFPRSVLATHSLTGKPSPAFKNKQAKMCLDPKKVSDILNEVRDKFLVQENCVRGIITTTCADESKMRKTRQIKKKENVPPKKSTKKASVNKPNTES